MSRRGTSKGRQDEPAPVARAQRVRNVSLCVVGGIGVFLSYPNFLSAPLFPLQWLALVPTLWVIARAKPRAAFGWGWLTGFVTNIGGFYWIDYLLQEFGHLPPAASVPITIVMAMYQGLVFGLWAALMRIGQLRAGLPLLVAAPAGFVLAEAIIPLIFPWYMANGQAPFIWASQILDLTGISGLTALIVWHNAAVFEALRRWTNQRVAPRRLLITVGAVWLAVLTYGAVRTGQIDSASEAAPKLSVGMVEANVGIWEKEAKGLPRELRAPTLLYNVIKHQRLSARAVQEGAELVVWPESSYIPLGEVAVKRTDRFAVAVGENGTIVEWRDDAWVAPASLLPEGSGAHALRTVSAASEANILAAGDAGLLLHWDGRTWKRLDADALDWVDAAWDGRDGHWLVARSGELFRWKNDSLERQAALGERARALAFDQRARVVFALSEAGALYELRAGSWAALSLETAGAKLHDISIAEDGSAVAVGQGVAVVREGGQWKSTPLPAGVVLHGAFAQGGDRALAVGEAGVLLEWNGAAWSRVPVAVHGALRSVSGTEDGRAVAVGDAGVVVERTPESGGWRVAQAPSNNHLQAAAGVGFELATGIPEDVAWFYRSPVPLPSGADAATVYAQEERVPWRDRSALLRGFEAPVLFGSVLFGDRPHPDGKPRVYNSALLVDRRGKVIGRYDKNYLLVFGEYIPFGEEFPVLYDWIPEASHFTAGTTVEAFDLPMGDLVARLGVMICYEDILPRFTRRLAGKETQLIVNVTNDAWFGKTAEPWLHLALAVARTIENRQWMARATNTGVSAFIDATGRMRQHTSIEGEELLIAEVPLLKTTTLYGRLGDWFTVLTCCVFVGSLGASLARDRKRRSVA
jgi:apolipoprotein N-acyltransferase